MKKFVMTAVIRQKKDQSVQQGRDRGEEGEVLKITDPQVGNVKKMGSSKRC